jgi:hypothetical protein
MRISIYKSLMCLLAFVQQGAAAPATSSPVTIEDALVAARANAEALHAVDMTASSSQKYVKQPKEPRALVPECDDRVLFDIKTGNFRRREVVKNPNEALAAVITAFDGSTVTEYDTASKQGFIHGKERVANEPRAPMIPLIAAGMFIKASPENPAQQDDSLEALLSQKNVMLKAALEMVNGVPCQPVVVRLPDGHDLPVAWLDPQRGFLPIRQLSYRAGSNNGTLEILSDVRILDAVQLDAGSGHSLWFPTKVRTIASSRDGSSFQLEVAANPKEIVLNPKLDEASFRVPFPVGTKILDEKTGETVIQTQKLSDEDRNWVQEPEAERPNNQSK